MANGMRAKPPANIPPEQSQQTADYFDTFGERMINIPTECDRAEAGMAEASAREQQAEVQHQANVNAAVNAAELISPEPSFTEALFRQPKPIALSLFRVRPYRTITMDSSLHKNPD